jgi:hypothetical protein
MDYEYWHMDIYCECCKKGVHVRIKTSDSFESQIGKTRQVKRNIRCPICHRVLIDRGSEMEFQ